MEIVYNLFLASFFLYPVKDNLHIYEESVCEADSRARRADFPNNVEVAVKWLNEKIKIVLAFCS